MSCPPVNELMDLWPALQIESELYAEFQRIMNQNLPNRFYAELDRHLPRLTNLFRRKASKTGKTADALADILKIHDEQDESDEPELDGVSVGLLTVISDHDTSPVHYHPVRISVVIESDAMVSLPRLGDAFLECCFNSVFRGHVTSQAIAGCSATSLTTQFRTYSLKAGREGKPLPIIFCDTMGLEESTGAGLDIDDISSILKGHLPDRYQFNPSAALHSEVHSYRKSPALKDKIHCVAYVSDACKVSIMPKKLEEKLDAIRRKVNLMGIPQLVLLTKVDEACPLVTEDVSNVYKSSYIKEMMQEVSARLGVPVSCVVPVKNYSEELELDQNCDILLLSAVIQMLRFADNYFDEISDRFSDIEIKA